MFKHFSNIFTKKLYIQFIFLLLFMLITALLDVISLSSLPIFLGVLISPDIVFQKVPQLAFLKEELFYSNFDYVLVLCFLVLIIFLLKNILLLLFNIFRAKFNYNIKIQVSNNLYSRYLNLNYSEHNKLNSSNFINNLTFETYRASSFILGSIKILNDLIIIILITLVLFFVDFKVSLTIFIYLLFVITLYYFLTSIKMKKLGTMLRQNRKKAFKLITESLGMIKNLFLMGNKKSVLSLFKKINHTNENSSKSAEIISSLPRQIIEISSVFLMLSIIVYIDRYGSGLKDSVPFFALITLSLIRFVPAFNSVSHGLSRLIFDFISFKKISEQLEYTLKLSKKENKERKKIIVKNFDKFIKIENLSFSFKERIKNEDIQNNKNKQLSEQIFENCNLLINKGEYIGITGKSGIGKTTLIDIVAGLINDYEGKIYFDNNLISNVFNLNKLISYVPQDIFLLDDTIKNNITLNNESYKYDHDPNDYSKSIKCSMLEELIFNLEEKDQTRVGEKGALLSGGQAQRIGIARSLYNNPKVLILDEATNALDAQNEKMFFQNLRKFYPDLTVILITHRISTLLMADKIYTIDRKKINFDTRLNLNIKENKEKLLDLVEKTSN